MMTTAGSAIDEDLICGGCEYNLRGLPRDGACPECGHSVAMTLGGYSRARARWLRRVAAGSMLIGGGVLLGGLGVLGREDGRWLLYLFATAAVVAAAGTWMFAGPEPRGGNGLGVLLRVAGLATMALQLCVATSIASAHGVLSGLPVVVAPRYVMGLCKTTAVLWGVAALLTCVRAFGLAKRFHDPPGAAQAALLGGLACFTFFVGVAVWSDPSLTATRAHLVMTAIHAGWSIIFFLGFSIVLRRKARRISPQPT